MAAAPNDQRHWKDPEGLLQKLRHHFPPSSRTGTEANVTQTSIKIRRSISIKIAHSTSPPTQHYIPRTRRRATR